MRGGGFATPSPTATQVKVDLKTPEGVIAAMVAGAIATITPEQAQAVAMLRQKQPAIPRQVNG